MLQSLPEENHPVRVKAQRARIEGCICQTVGGLVRRRIEYLEHAVDRPFVEIELMIQWDTSVPFDTRKDW